ncbi:MAG: amino acid ABC transporter ATP-binding protein [Ignavibacteria bacterium]|nr:amino acid ABC transporter ATP-binding protein [Ignavibacteria bacterium]
MKRLKLNGVVLEVRNIYKKFGNIEILKNLSFSVQKGELISIIGRSGCGKTTLLRCINCLEIFDYGYLRVGEIEIERTNLNLASKNNGFIEEIIEEKAQKIRQKVGMLFQNLNLFPHLTVLENITLAPIVVKKEPKEKAIDNALKLLEKVGLKGYENRYPYQLSGGQSQRVAIARSLAMNPEIMLYDEPTSALDPELIGEVLNVMIDLHQEGMTQIVVTHAMNFAKSASDYVMYMENGEIIEIGKPEKIFGEPNDPRTEAYVRLFKE